MERRIFAGCSAILVLLVPLILEIPRPVSSGAPFSYTAYCRDLEGGTNSLFVSTVRRFQDPVAEAYNRYFGQDLAVAPAPPQGNNRLARMFSRLREARGSSPDIDELVAEVEDVFLLSLQRLERDCKRQIHG